MPTEEDIGARAGLRERLEAIPAWVRAAGAGLVAGAVGGAVATTVDPPSTLLTVLIAAAVVCAVTVGFRRVR